MLEIVNIRVRSFDLSYLDIYFDVVPCYEDVRDYELILQTSDAEFGPYHDLSEPMIDVWHVRDNTVRGQHSLYHQRYYRVIVRKRADPLQTATYPSIGGAKLSAPADLIALEMARINHLKLREFVGRKLWVFPRKQTGQRCGVCYDRVLERKIKSACPVCFDASWVGGFHAPIQAYGVVISPGESSLPANFTKVQNENTTLLLGNYPELSEGDMVVEAENQRWRVGSELQKIRKARALIRQQAAIHRIPKGDIEFSIPLRLSEDEVRNLVAAPARNFTNPQSMTSVSLTEALNSTFGAG